MRLRGGFGIEQERHVDPPDVALEQGPQQIGRVVHPVGVLEQHDRPPACRTPREIGQSLVDGQDRNGGGDGVPRFMQPGRKGLGLCLGRLLPVPIEADHRHAGVGAVGIGEAGHHRDVAIAGRFARARVGDDPGERLQRRGRHDRGNDDAGTRDREAGTALFAQRAQQRPRRPLAGLAHVDMRRVAIGNSDIRVAHGLTVDIAVIVERDRDRQGRHRGAHRGDDGPLDILIAGSPAGPVQEQDHAVERTAAAQPFDDLSRIVFDGLVRRRPKRTQQRVE